MKHKPFLFLLLIAFTGLFSQAVKSQEVALKTNLLSDGFLNPNLGMEVGVAPKWTVQPQARYWLCDRFGGHFFGVHVHGGQFNVGGIDLDVDFLGTDFSKLKDSRFQGWFVGAGVSYGYDWVLNKHWNLEAEIGVGYSYTRFDQFRCAGCGKKIASDKSHNYYGITRLSIGIVYLF